MFKYYFLSFERNPGSILNLMPQEYTEGNNCNIGNTKKHTMTFLSSSFKTNNRKRFSTLHNSIVETIAPEHDRYQKHKQT